MQSQRHDVGGGVERERSGAAGYAYPSLLVVFDGPTIVGRMGLLGQLRIVSSEIEVGRAPK